MEKITKIFEGALVRIFEDRDGEPWFLAKDVCDILEIGNTSQAVNRLDSDEKNTIILNEGIGNPNKTAINEFGLYALVLSSRKPEARRFKRWVTHEVLPSIRKTGGYVQEDKAITFVDSWLPQLDDTTKHIVASTLEANRKLRSEVAGLTLENSEMAPKASYYDSILKNPSLITTTIIAKDYGMSAAEFNRLLHSKGIQYRQGSTWILYAKYQDKGYTQSYTLSPKPNVVITTTKWTQKGRVFLYHTLKREGIYPLIECEEYEVI